MSSKSNKEYGRKPYLFKTYDDMMRTQSELQATSSGKSFKHSEMKKPYLADNYEQMERMYSPSQPSPYGFWQGYELWDSEGMSDEDFNKMLNDWFKSLPGGAEIPPIKNLPCNCPNCLAHSPIPSEVCCGGASSVPISFYIIGTRRTSLPVHSEPGFNDSADITVGDMPLPSSCGEGSSPCVTNLITLHFDCTGEWTVRQASLKICGETHTINISKDCGGGGGGCPCDALTITAVGGGTADDTILAKTTPPESNSYSVSGCCGTSVWSVSVDAGSTLGGSTISQAGVLTAGATACGSLKVTATCEACETSATQYVRVADGGKWVLIYSCDECVGCGVNCGPSPITFISGKYKDIIDYATVNPDTSCTRYQYVCGGSGCETCHQFNKRYHWKC